MNLKLRDVTNLWMFVCRLLKYVQYLVYMICLFVTFSVQHQRFLFFFCADGVGVTCGSTLSPFNPGYKRGSALSLLYLYVTHFLVSRVSEGIRTPAERMYDYSIRFNVRELQCLVLLLLLLFLDIFFNC